LELTDSAGNPSQSLGGKHCEHKCPHHSPPHHHIYTRARSRSIPLQQKTRQLTCWCPVFPPRRKRDKSRSTYWSGYPIPSPGDLPDPGIELGPPELQANSLPTELTGKPLKPK